MVRKSNPLGAVRLPILTHRLSLVRPHLSKAPELPPLVGDWEVARWLLRVPYPYRRSDALTFLRATPARYRSGTSLSLLITGRQDGLVMGGIGLHGLDWEHRHGEIGYWLARRHWGQGFGSEAVQALLTVAFRDLKLHRIEAGTFEANERSGHVLRKAGFRPEGVRREAFYKWGRWRDDLLFGLTDKDWRAANRARKKSNR